MNKFRKRYTSNNQLTREQAIWLCRAILTHYRSDGQTNENLMNQNDVVQRSHKSDKYKRGREWVRHPVGYDLNEEWYGSQTSGFREAWASLVSLPISRTVANPSEYRTYTTYGLVNENRVSIAVYHITEVVVTTKDDAFCKYVFDCFARLQDDAKESPEYDPKRA